MIHIPDIIRETLPGGLELIMVPRPGLRVVTINAWVATGSADEPPEFNGISHFLEHMLFKGTQRFGVGEIDRLVEGVGGLMNAGTSHDFTDYYITAAAERFDTTLDALADFLRNSTLVPDEMDRERRVILEEYYRKQDDPGGVLWETLYDRSFESGPYKAPVLGTPETLNNIDHDQLIRYYRGRYTPDRIALVVVGDAPPEKISESVHRVFADFERPTQQFANNEQYATTYAEGQETVVEKDVVETYGVMGFPAPPLKDHRQTCALDVLQFVLGGGHASFLYHEVKEKQRLANSIGAGCANARYPDLFTVFYSCICDKRDRLEQAALEQVDRVRQEPPSAKALDRARRLLINSHAFALETSNGQASSIGYYYTITGSTEFERNYIEGVENVTAEEVQREAQEWLNPEKMNRAVVRPKSKR